MRVGGNRAPADPRLIEAYEGMRRRHRHEGCGGAGYEVLRRQGLAAWIEAFAGCVGAVRPDPSPALTPSSLGATVAPAVAKAGGGWVPVSVYPELIRLVAGLALGRLKEQRP